MRFIIEISEKLVRTIEVDASNEEEALETVRMDYFKEKYVLDSEDYISTDFFVI